VRWALQTLKSKYSMSIAFPMVRCVCVCQRVSTARRQKNPIRNVPPGFFLKDRQPIWIACGDVLHLAGSRCHALIQSWLHMFTSSH
jgi:hypothetical protein